jgi:CBS domain-containing protein
MAHKISDIITHRKGTFWKIEPEETVFSALEELNRRDVGALIVMKGEKLIGVISERDYARKVVLKGRNSQTTLVSEIMSAPVITIGNTATIDQAMSLMTTEGIRHLPVLEEGKVVAVISMGDVVSACLRDQRDTIKFYKDIELDT